MKISFSTLEKKQKKNGWKQGNNLDSKRKSGQSVSQEKFLGLFLHLSLKLSVHSGGYRGYAKFQKESDNVGDSYIDNCLVIK